jgi:RNA polymerase sigma-70 factor, ECF subfamily
MTFDRSRKSKNEYDSKERKLIELYNECYPRIARYVFVRIGNQMESEDIASDVFVKALDSLDSYQDRGLPMEAWLFKIAHNLVVDYLRKSNHRKTVTTDDIDIVDKSDPVSDAETSIEIERVNEAMKDLTDDQREVVRLRFFGCLTSKEVASLLNKSDGAVREMQRAALEKLRKILK